MSNDEKSLGDQHTFSGGRSDAHANRGPQSLGDQATYGDAASGGDAVFDDGMEVIDLSARYKIEGTLGQGGMGAVLLAIDTRLNRKVAIKRILGAAARSQTAVNRFLTEAQSIAALNHPNIVQIYDYGRAADGPFLIMEFVEGSSLLEKCEQGPLPLEEAVELTSQLCEGLGKAHAAGIIHRDIKPANVLLTADGAPKLTDFGLAKAETTEAAHTMVGAVLGTLDFMPPEQRRDAALTDHRSDLWSLAATLYQMVTGKSPKIIKFNDVPKSLQDVLGKALEDDKNDRYQSAKEFRDALTGALAGAGAAADLSQGECPGCGARNEASRKFCKGCGSKLEAQCLSCHAEMPLWEEFCGNCGTKQSELLDERRQVLARQQSDAEQLLSDGSYDEAVGTAEKLKEEPDPRLRSIKQWAENFIGRIDAQKTALRQQAEAALEEARKHFEAGDYTTARKTLEQIPPVGATPETEAFTTEVRGVCDEIATLSQQIRQRIDAKEINGLLPIVDRYLELKPANTHIQELREKLVVRGEKQQRAQVEALEHARSLFEAGDEDGCLAYIESVPEDHESDELAQLLQGIVGRRERRRTIRENFRSKQYTGLLPLTESYLAENPADEELQQILQSLLERNKKLDVQLAQLVEAVEQARSTGEFGKAIALLGKVPEDRWDSTFSQLKADLQSLKSARGDVLQGLQNAQSLSQFTDAIQAANAYYTSFAEQTSEDATLTSAVGVAKKQAAVLSRNRRIMRGVYATLATAAVVAVGFVYFTYQHQQKVARTIADAKQRGAEAIAVRAYSEAVAAFDEVLTLRPNDAEALIQRADAKLTLDPPDSTGAAADLVAAEAVGVPFDNLKPVRELLTCVEAEVLAQSQDLAEADTKLSELKTAKANSALIARVESAIGAALLTRAQDFAAAGETDQALADIAKATAMAVPADAVQQASDTAAVELAKVARERLLAGETDDAIKVASAGQILDADNSEVLSALADAYVQTAKASIDAGDQESASAAFLSARQANPSAVGLRDLALSLADSLVQRCETQFGDAAYQEAVAALATVAATDPSNAGIEALKNRLGTMLLAEAEKAIAAEDVDRTAGLVESLAELNVLQSEQARLTAAAASLLFRQGQAHIEKNAIQEAVAVITRIQGMPVDQAQKTQAVEALVSQLEPAITAGLKSEAPQPAADAVGVLFPATKLSEAFIASLEEMPETTKALLPHETLSAYIEESLELTFDLSKDASKPDSSSNAKIYVEPGGVTYWGPEYLRKWATIVYRFDLPGPVVQIDEWNIGVGAYNAHMNPNFDNSAKATLEASVDGKDWVQLFHTESGQPQTDKTNDKGIKQKFANATSLFVRANLFATKSLNSNRIQVSQFLRSEPVKGNIPSIELTIKRKVPRNTITTSPEIAAPKWLTNGLVSYYPFDGDSNDLNGQFDGDASALNDIGFDGVGSNFVVVRDRFGQKGKALQFGGSADSYVEVPISVGLLDSMSVSFWFLVEPPGFDDGRYNDVMLSIPKYNTDRRYPSGGVQFEIGNGRDRVPAAVLSVVASLTRPAPVHLWPRVSSTKSVADSVYHHAVVSVSDSAMSLFLDGVSVGSAVISASAKPEGYISIGRAFNKNTNDGSNPAQRCRIDDVRVYDRPLSPVEIRELYEHESLPRASNKDVIELRTGWLSDGINSVGMQFVRIAPGRFTMGSTDGEKDEQPVHNVTITKPYYLGKTEVTNGEWEAVMGHVPSEWKEAALPVESVTWDEAVAFCEALSALPAERQAGRVYRLPTEAEWEYACRAGTTTAYSFGDDSSLLGDFAWYSANSGRQTHPVGEKRPNSWGLYDMHGNVWEWCSDGMGGYAAGPVRDPAGPASGSFRVLRGGSWNGAGGHCRSADRNGPVPSYRYFDVGFRLALSPSGARSSPEASE